MNAMFDTLKFARTLRDRGRFTPDQAEGLADAFAEAMGSDVAGRADLKAMESILRGELHDSIAAIRIEMHDGFAAVRAEIASLRTEMKGIEKGLEAKIEAAKTDTIKWIVGIIGVQTIAIVGAAVILARYLTH